VLPWQWGGMRILHILDHGLPLHSGYTFPDPGDPQGADARGWDVAAVTSPRHGKRDTEETIDGIRFYRTAAGQFGRR
jgi:glycogen(starch) synthase